MKHESVLILLLGHDPRLLETRQWVLQSRGYRVLTASGLSGISSVPRSKPVSLLLLCHTLNGRERDAAIGLARSRWPEVRHMSVAADDVRAPNGILGNLLHTMDGPAKLISMVGDAMRREPVRAQAQAS